MTPLLELIRRYLAAEPYRRLSDDDLWARFAGPPDDQALCALLERCGSRIFARCQVVIGDEHLAEEAFQDAVCELYHRRARLPTYRAAVAWLYQTATSRARKARRRHWRAVRRDQAKATATRELVAARAEVAAIEREDLSAVLGALAELPARQRRALELVYQEGLTHEEAATALGWSRGAVGVYVTRGLDRLRAVLRNRGVLTTGGGAVALEAVLSARMPALTAERAATLAGGVLVRLEARSLARVGMTAVPWKVVAAVGLAAGLAVAGLVWGPSPVPEPSPDPPTPLTPPLIEETLQAKNLRIFQADVVPNILAILQKHLPAGNEFRVARTWAVGPEVWGEFRPSRPKASQFPMYQKIGFCVLRREMLFEYRHIDFGKWLGVDGTGGIHVRRYLPIGPVREIRTSDYHEDIAAIHQALRALPRDERAELELVRWHFGPTGWAGTDLVIPSPAAGCRGVAGTRGRLYVRIDDKVFVRTETSGWRYWGRGEGSHLAANDTHLFHLRGTEVWSHPITTPLAASVKVCPTPKSQITPNLEEVAYMTANNDFLFVKTKGERRIWRRSLKDPTREWVYFSGFDGWGVAVSQDRLFTVNYLKDHDQMMVQELSQAEGTWKAAVYTIPHNHADHLTVWGDRLIYPCGKDVLARPIARQSGDGWKVIGRHQDPDWR